MKCPKCGAKSPYYGVISDLMGRTEKGHYYCVKCGHEEKVKP